MDGTAAASNVACPATLKKVTIRYCVVARAYGLCVVAIFWGAMNVDRFEQHTFGKGRWSASLSGVARQGWPRLLLTSLALAACSQGTMAQTVAFQQTTACAYSYTVPAGVTSVQVAIGGAGAGGGSGDFNGGNGGNGGAGAGGRLMTRLPSGREFEIGKVLAWAPGALLRFSWRPASVAPDHATEVEVRFEPVGDETRVTVEHRGWDGVPQAHAARHGFPLGPFQARLADHWRGQLRRLAENARNS